MEVKGTDYTAPERKSWLEIVVPIRRGIWRSWPLSLLKKGTRLRVKPPTKRTWEDVVRVCEMVDAAIDGEVPELEIADCYPIVAKAMSNNREGIEVTVDDLEEARFDMEDVEDFLGYYIFFITELANSKN